MPRKKSGFTQKKYYKQNKEGISWVKKQRYRDDPEYREKILQRAKEAHLKKKGISGVERVDSNIFRIDGITYYTVNHIAKACDVSSSLISYYHEMGYLPKPKQIGEYTWRMYRSEYVEAVIPIITDYLNRVFTSPQEMAEKLSKKLGDLLKEITE